MTIPTTNRATTETPANTPKPIGNTSNFFPGGSGDVAAPAFPALGFGEGDELEGWDKGEDVEDEGGVVVESALSGCGVAAGFGTEEVP